MADAGLVVISSFISPYEEDRNAVREKHLLDDQIFLEAYVNCSLEVAESRDPKGLYKKARAGLIKGFTGIDDPFEKPADPELNLETDRYSVEEIVDTIICCLENKGIIMTNSANNANAPECSPCSELVDLKCQLLESRH
eukprot:Filipodium_phascolosomae@DN2639_c2_g1_i3.p1